MQAAVKFNQVNFTSTAASTNN